MPTVPIVGAGALFTRLGHIFGGINDVNFYRGTTMPARTQAIHDDFLAADANEVSVIWSQLAGLQAAQAGYLTQQAGLAASILTDMIYDSNPSLPDRTLLTIMKELVRQMVANGDTVDASTAAIAITPAVGNVGDASLIGTPRITNGKMAENALAETLTTAVTSVSPPGGTVSIRGSIAVQDPLSQDWPGGSGTARSIDLVDASQDGGSGTRTFLRNGNFELWTTPDDPDFWTVRTGTPGTTVKQTSVAFDGLSALEIVGNGSQFTAIDAEFGLDSPSVLQPQTCYAAHLWCRCTGTPAAGVLTVSLVDGLGTVLNDDSGGPSSFSVALTSLGTAYVPKGGFLRTPKTLPPVVRLRVGLSTALSAGTSVYLDRAAFTTATSLYTQGPLVAGFSGVVPVVVDDSWSAVVTNDRAGKFQEFFERCFRMRDALQILLPSNAAGAETISDSLII